MATKKPIRRRGKKIAVLPHHHACSNCGQPFPLLDALSAQWNGKIHFAPMKCAVCASEPLTKAVSTLSETMQQFMPLMTEVKGKLEEMAKPVPAIEVSIPKTLPPVESTSIIVNSESQSGMFHSRVVPIKSIECVSIGDGGKLLTQPVARSAPPAVRKSVWKRLFGG